MRYTRDGYSVTMPRFRMRRLRRRLRAGRYDDLDERAASRLFDVVVGRARRTAGSPSSLPRFTTQVGRQRLMMVTRALAPRHVELLYVRRWS